MCSIQLPTLHEICIVAVQALHAHSQNWRTPDFWSVCTADFRNQAVLLKVPQNVQKYPSMLCTGASSDGAKVTSMDVQNCIPNHLNRNQQKYNYKQKQKNTQGFPEYVFEEGESL